MRTAILAIAGFAFLALLLAVARSFKPSLASAAGSVVPSFIIIWGLIAGANMWFGLSQSGRSFMDELPVFLIIFLLPTAAALLVKWNWR